MKNSEFFESALNKASEIRKYIQEKLRRKYNTLQKAWGIATESDGKKLKFYTDMVYYRDGGYPNENSLPKHVEVMEQFIELIKFADFLGIRPGFVDSYLNANGISVTISDSAKITNTAIDGEPLHKAQEILRKENHPLGNSLVRMSKKALLAKMIEETMQLQREICSNSDEIKYSIAKQVENNCEINKSDFTGAIKFKVLSEKNKINNAVIEREKKNINSTIAVYNAKARIVNPEATV